MGYYEDERYDYEDAPVVKKGGGFFGKFVALCLGFVLGVGSTVGGVAGGGYLLASKISIQKAAELISTAAGTNVPYQDYVTEEYAKKTLLDLIKDVYSMAGKEWSEKTLTLARLEEISPKVGDLAKAVQKMLADYGATFTVEELMQTPLPDILNFVKQEAFGIEVGTLLGKLSTSGLSPIMMNLCYGIEGYDYYIENGKVVMYPGHNATTVGSLVATNDFLNLISISAIMDEPDLTSSLMRTLIYGEEGVRYTYDETNGVQMKPFTYSLDGNTFTDLDGATYVYDDTLQGYQNSDGSIIIREYTPASAMVAVVGETSSNPADADYIVLTMEDNGEGGKTPVPTYLLASNSEGSFDAYQYSTDLTKVVLVKCRPLAISSLLTGNIMDKFYGVELAELIGDKAQTDTLMRALCYGVEGEDYDIVDNKVVMKDGKKPTSIGSLIQGGTGDMLNAITLADIIGDKAQTDTLMRALCYGVEGEDYDIVNNKVVMKDGKKPTTIGSLIEGGTGDMLNAIALADIIGDKAQTDTIMRALCYGVEGEDYDIVNNKVVMKDGKKPTTIGSLIEGGTGDLLNSIALADVLGDKAQTDTVMRALCYGVEGEDYDMVNGKVVMKDGKKPTTIGSLIEGGTSDLLNSIALADILGDKAQTDTVMRALCYGVEGEDYDIVDNKVVMKDGKKPTTIGSLIEGGTSDLLNSIALADIIGDKAHTDEILRAMCFGVEGEDYDIVAGKVVMKDGKKPKTIGSLMQNGTDDLLNSIELATVIGDNAKTDPILRALCYGAEGVDYDIVDGEIKMKDGKKPTTIGTLMTNGTGDLVNSIELAAVMGDSAKTDPVIRSLCYGEEGVDYDIVDGEIKMKDGKKPKTIGDLKTNGTDEMIKGLELGSVLKLNGSSDAILLALAYGKKGVDFTVNSDNSIACANPRTIGDLMNGEDLMNEMDLSVFVTPTDTLTKYLVYGVKGAHFIENGAGQVTMLHKRIAYGAVGGETKAFDVCGNDVTAKVSLVAGTTYQYVDGDVTYYFDTTTPAYQHADATVKKTHEGLPYYVLADVNGTAQFFESRKLGDLTGSSSPLNTAMNDLTIGDLLGGGSTSTLMQAIGSWKISDLNDNSKVNGLTLADLLPLGDNPSKLMKTLGGKTLGWITASGNIESLPLSDIIEVSSSSPALLQTIATWTLADLSTGTKVNDLKIGQLINAGENPHKLLTTISNWSLADLASGSKINGLKIGDLIEIGESSHKLLKTISTWSLAELSAGSKINGLQIGDLIEIGEGSHKLLKTISTWSLEELSAGTKINGLKIGDLIEIGTSSHKLLKTISTWTLAELSAGTKINSLKIGDLIEIGAGSHKLLTTISTWTLAELSAGTKINGLKIGDLIEIGEGSHALLKAIQGWTLAELSAGDKINGLRLDEIMTISPTDSALLHALADTTIGELPNRLNSLSVQEVCMEELFEMNGSKYVGVMASAPTTQVEVDEPHYYHYTITVSGKTVHKYKLYIKDVRAICEEAGVTEEDFDITAAYATQYEFIPTHTHLWEYLLTDQDGNRDTAYPVSDMNAMVHNMTANMQKVSMYTLNTDFGMGFSDAFMGHDLIPAAKVAAGIADPEGTKIEIGHLTISEMSAYIDYILNLYEGKVQSDL